MIWKGDSLIDGVPETLDFLRSQGKQLVFVTNNSTKSRAGYLKKFTGLGLNVSAEEIYSSSYAAAAYLEATNFPSDKKVYVVGDVGIEEELDLKGISHIGGPSDADKVLKDAKAIGVDEIVRVWNDSWSELDSNAIQILYATQILLPPTEGHLRLILYPKARKVQLIFHWVSIIAKLLYHIRSDVEG